jgi:hypothetical protein
MQVWQLPGDAGGAHGAALTASAAPRRSPQNESEFLSRGDKSRVEEMLQKIFRQIDSDGTCIHPVGAALAPSVPAARRRP